MDDCGNCGDFGDCGGCDFDCCDCDCKCDDCLQGSNVIVICCCLSSTNNNNNQTSSNSKRNSDGCCCCCCYGRRDPPKVKVEKNKNKKKKKKRGICWRIWCYCCLCCSKEPDLSPPPSPPHPKTQDLPFGKGSNDSSVYEKHLDKTSDDHDRAGGQSDFLKNERDVVPSSISYSPDKKHHVIPVRDKEGTERYRKDHNYGRDKREEYFGPPSKDKYRWDRKYDGMPEELESDYYRRKHDKFDKYGDRENMKKYGYGKIYSKYDDEEFGFGRKGYGYGERGDKYSKREEMGMSVVKDGYGGRDEKLAARHYELEKPKRDDQDKKKADMARKQDDDLGKEHQKMKEEVKITTVKQGDHDGFKDERKKDQAQGEKHQTLKDTPSKGGTHQKDDGQDVKVTKPVELSVMPSMELRYGRQSTEAAKSQAGDYGRVDPMLDELGKL